MLEEIPFDNSKKSQNSTEYPVRSTQLLLRFPQTVNPLTPNDHYSGRTAPLTSKRCILCIYSTNIGTEYFKRGIYSPLFSSKCSLFHNSRVFGSCVIHIQVVLKFKKKMFRRKKVNLLIHYYALNLLRETEILLPSKVRAMHIFIQRCRQQYQLNYRYVSPSFIAAQHHSTCITLHFKQG